MSKNYAIIIQFVLPLTPFYRSGARRSDVYKRDAFVRSWRFHNRAWQPERRDRLPETSGTLWIHRGALTNQRCSLATGCGINIEMVLVFYVAADVSPIIAASVFVILTLETGIYIIRCNVLTFVSMYACGPIYISVLSKVENPGSPNRPSIVDAWVVCVTFRWSVYDVVRNDSQSPRLLCVVYLQPVPKRH